MMDRSLPGHELIQQGLDDLAASRVSVESLLVSMACTRLRSLGVPVPTVVIDAPELRLYRKLQDEYGDGAHSKYNAYRRRLASFLRTAACVRSSTDSE